MSRILDLSAPTRPKARHKANRLAATQTVQLHGKRSSRKAGPRHIFFHKAGHPSQERAVSRQIRFRIISIPLQCRFFFSLAWVFPSTLFIERHQDARPDARPIHSFIGGLGFRYLRDSAHYPPLRWSLGTLGWREKVLVEPMVALALRSSIFLRSISS